MQAWDFDVVFTVFRPPLLFPEKRDVPPKLGFILVMGKSYSGWYMLNEE